MLLVINLLQAWSRRRFGHVVTPSRSPRRRAPATERPLRGA